MAVTVETQRPTQPPRGTSGGEFQGRHLLIGTNVTVSILIAVAIVAALQWGGYYNNAKVDMTRRGVNSLAPGTQRVLEGLDENLRFTSLYFETDLESEDQSKYRTHVGDLLALMQSASKSQIEVDTINPLQDHAAREEFLDRLISLEAFAEEVKPYEEFVETFRGAIAPSIGETLQEDLNAILDLEALLSDQKEIADLGQVQNLLQDWKERVALANRDLEEKLGGSRPQYAQAKSIITGVYSNLSRDLEAIVKFAKQSTRQRQDLSQPFREFLDGVESRYRPLIDELQTASTDANELPRLKLDDVLRQLGPTDNALVVWTDRNAEVVSFNEMWPPVDPNIPAPSAAFKDRTFKGEAKVMSAVLQLTEDKKTAIVFTRFAGPPLFFGGMPGMQQQQAPYAQLKTVLEDANFVVKEWDLATSNEPPEIDPEPARVIYIVTRPMQPPMDPRNPQGQQKFGKEHEETLLGHMGENPRAIFLTGWAPGPFGAMPDPYPLNDYLTDEWGVHVASDTLVIRAVGVAPGEFRLGRGFFMVNDFARTDHVIVRDLKGLRGMFSAVSPLEIADEPPKGVEVDKLLYAERSEGLWGVSNVQSYIEKARTGDPVNKLADDVYGPFTIAAAATRGDGKLVVIGSRGCMEDQIAMASGLTLGPEGLRQSMFNPANVRLLMNSLHWLNDKEEWMSVGRPVSVATLEIDEGSELTFIRAFVQAIWPALMLGCGVVAWWVRRR